MQISSTNKGSARAGWTSRRLISSISIAAVLAVTAGAAKADDQITIQEIKDLKARLKTLEKRLDKQSAKTDQVLRREAALPVSKGPYEPPQPWDKKIHLNGITITPGGFFAMEGVYRQRYQGADIGDLPFGGIPALNSPLAHMNELRFSARQSRVSALVQGNVNPDILVSGYGELDFLGAGNTANSNESNSYNLRIRHMYATVDWQSEGVHVLAGQNWSLATLQGKGITPRNEIIPLTIDAQYVAGFTWTRQPGLRVVKNFGDDIWLGLSAEMSQTPGITGCPGVGAFAPGAGNSVGFTGVAGSFSAACDTISGGGGLLNQLTTYSLNHVPDIIGKAVWEPTIGDRRLHLEAMAMYTDLYDRAYFPAAAVGNPSANYDTAGWGAGGGFIIPVMPKFADLTGSALVGRGIERYGSAQLASATFNANGSLDALPEAMFLGGLTVHATPQLDLYLNGGGEKILSPQYFGTYSGYGNPASINNTGCFTEFGTCSALTKDVWEITGGFWDKVYDGALGSLRVGLQYAYIKRDFMPGTSGRPAGSAAIGGSTDENAGYFSIRYYPFDVPPPPPVVAGKY